MHLKTPNMPSKLEYSSYINTMDDSGFVQCISDYLKEVQVRNILESPFFSIMLDEST